MKNIIILFVLFINIPALSFPIPSDNKVSFDVIRKNKIIGSVNSEFEKENDKLKIRTILEIKVKLLFIPAYSFFQDTTETWVNEELIEVKGYTDFEDEREYYIDGRDTDQNFIASGMDGELILDKNIITLNYWNKKILEEEEVFDTQKGIVRKILVNKLDNEVISIKDDEIETEKYILNATKNPKDKGPFPEYTLWYYGDELVKFEFLPPKQKKKIQIIRNDWVK
tara:strand:+ start:11163 stop:11837 length:675 start_codon:yes stop_codon:yes gene_type:complete